MYSVDFNHPVWLAKRKKVIERDGKCIECGTTSNLNVTSIQYLKGLKPYEYPLSELVTMCNKCIQTFKK